MRCFWTLVLWICFALPLSAQDAQTAARLVTAFETWIAENNAKTGTLSVRFKGEPVVQHGVGTDADTVMEMASLGKAVTGICVAEVVREGLLGYDDVFSDIVGKGPDLSVAQLLNQTSGLRTDSTQKLMVKRFAKAGHRSADVVDAVIKRGAPKGAVGQFRYNNENYALLAPMIEEVTQTDFERACQARVFAPAGVLAQVSAVAASSLSWGGWAMSADDYAQFHSYWFGPDSAYGQDPFALPHAQLDGGVRYGHGMFIRASQDSYNFWHFGALCFPSGHNSGSYAVSWQGKWSAVAAYDVCPDWDAMKALDGALARAVFQ